MQPQPIVGEGHQAHGGWEVVLTNWCSGSLISAVQVHSIPKHGAMINKIQDAGEVAEDDLAKEFNTADGVTWWGGVMGLETYSACLGCKKKVSWKRSKCTSAARSSALTIATSNFVQSLCSVQVKSIWHWSLQQKCNWHHIARGNWPGKSLQISFLVPPKRP